MFIGVKATFIPETIELQKMTTFELKRLHITVKEMAPIVIVAIVWVMFGKVAKL